MLHINHMGTEKKILARESVHLGNINNGIKDVIKSCSTCLESQKLKVNGKLTAQDIPSEP